MRIEKNPNSWAAKKRSWAKKQRKKAAAIDRDFEARVISLYDKCKSREEIVCILTSDWKGGVPFSLYHAVDRILRKTGRE